MPERWVLNSSPLIVLSRIGQADLFLALTEQVVVPRAVALEIEAGPAGDSAKTVIAAGRFAVEETPPPPSDLLAWDLGKGETAVLAFALANFGWTAILDDAAARRCAHSFSLPVKGTLGIVILAKQSGLIRSAAETIQSLRRIGFRLDERVVRDALARTVGETWPPQ